MLALSAPMRIATFLTAFALVGYPALAQTPAPEQAATSAPEQAKTSKKPQIKGAKPAKHGAQQANDAAHSAEGSAPSSKNSAEPAKTTALPAKSAARSAKGPETPVKTEAKQGNGFTDVVDSATSTKAASAAPKTKTTLAPKTKGVTQASAQATPSTVTRVPKTATAKSRTPLVVDGAASSDGVKALVSQYARLHGVPETLAHRVVLRESRYNPSLMGRGHFGLMQISLPTARQMGYAGPPQGLFDARTNLAHGMPYLANAWLVSGGSEARAVALYSRGYYYDAKRKGLIKSLRTARSAPVEPVDAEAVAVAE